MKYDIVAIGGAMRDIIFYTDDGLILDNPKDPLCEKLIAFELGAKIYIKGVYFDSGGGANNAAAGFAKLGLKTAVILRVGQDREGDALIKALRDNTLNAETPILILATDVAEAKKKCSEISNKNLTFFTKPVKKEVFIELVKRIVFVPAQKTAATKLKINIDVNFINPFIEATVKTLHTMAKLTDIKPGKVKV
ncbi:hypothetical protein IID20_05415, partial [Patescibacteria group bacterium]|nr:hypothetical protein [Patescibacteria group bacterium]